jgi:hypothetical protein
LHRKTWRRDRSADERCEFRLAARSGLVEDVLKPGACGFEGTALGGGGFAKRLARADPGAPGRASDRVSPKTVHSISAPALLALG